MALPVGAAILSLCVFLLLLAGAASATSFLALGICAQLPYLWRHNLAQPGVKHEPVDHISAWILTGILSAYGVLYVIHALTPEIQPDALYYHLGQAAEYSRLGKFPAHIDFYSVLPQGMEMLYLFAFAFGEHPAAKLVHFAFLIATGPVLLAVGRKLGLGDTVCWTAAAF